jgi:hypothetical protein
MTSGEALVGLERCPRIPFWAAQWKPRKMQPFEMIEAGVRAGLMELTRSDYGDLAGEEVYGFGSDPGIDSKQYDQHSEVVHLACLADIITSAIRRPGGQPWVPAPDLANWTSGCYVSPDRSRLRRIVYVTSWNDDRHYAVCREWQTLGEVCHHKLPMQLLVVILGQHRDGKYHSFWSHALLHPANKKLRFRKRNKVSEPFKETWTEIWREDYDNITTRDWLEGMLEDRVLEDLLLKIDIEVPPQEQRHRLIDLAQKKLAIIRDIRELPMQNLSTCDWPKVCTFRRPCHLLQEPGPVFGFVPVQTLVRA